MCICIYIFVEYFLFFTYSYVENSLHIKAEYLEYLLKYFILKLHNCEGIKWYEFNPLRPNGKISSRSTKILILI